MKKLSILFLSCVFYNFCYSQITFDLRLAGGKNEYKLHDSITVEIIADETAFSVLKGKQYKLMYGKEGENDGKVLEGYIFNKRTIVNILPTDLAQVLRIKASIEIDSEVIIKEIGAVIDSDNLRRTTIYPIDFASFWKRQLEGIQEVALDSKIIQAVDLSSETVDVYYVNYVVDKDGSRFYGVLTIPKQSDKNTKMPVVVIYPGAGVRPYSANMKFAEANIITLQLGVHGIPINSDPGLYSALAKGALNGYPYFNLQSKDTYYFNRVIKGCVRALDFLETLDEVDSEKIVVSGSSQGGALSLIVTGLDERIKAVAVYCPALCQTNGSMFDEPSGWPQPLKNITDEWVYASREQVIPYYDVVNFVKAIKVPVFMTWGLIDDVTPATTIYAAYNTIVSERRKYVLADVAHANHPSQIMAVYDFITDYFKVI
ncbi:acetylxylan esterase [Sphingobacterium sp. UT-1RO-CII-1]|uniref:acetylxylan esterase n=1 Tax=Sphingobacterium sp. UT-1RO-CII-1 TaxID=2995225 RepID=UPI00227B9E2C|nr:acetylxylan esterase [Sphingobacterium sp. UT-1RO-CII-1]MCY4779615.1 acetylxylan esterase [Sphingobacterium sp. UT-1RO-CII-1]